MRCKHTIFACFKGQSCQNRESSCCCWSGGWCNSSLFEMWDFLAVSNIKWHRFMNRVVKILRPSGGALLSSHTFFFNRSCCPFCYTFYISFPSLFMTVDWVICDPRFLKDPKRFHILYFLKLGGY